MEEDRSEQELRGVAAFVAANKKTLSGRCAIVAANPLHFGLSRIFQAYCASDQARAWFDRTG